MIPLEEEGFLGSGEELGRCLWCPGCFSALLPGAICESSSLRPGNSYSFIHLVFLEHLFILGQALCEAWVFHCEQLGGEVVL